MQGLRFFDANVALGPRRVPGWGEAGNTPGVVARLAECGVTEALVYHTASLEAHPDDGNRLLAPAIRGFPGLYPVWALLPLGTGELGGPRELAAGMKVAGVRAVLVYPAEHTYSGAEWCCGDLYDLLERMAMPVFTRFTPADFSWSELDTLLTDHPRLPVVLRNLNYQVDRSLYRLLERHENLRIETTRYLVFDGIEQIVRRFGARRLIFGSETPLLSPGAAVTPILTARIDPEDKARIAGGNLRALVEAVRYDP